MKRIVFFLLILGLTCGLTNAQAVYTLDSCRAMALRSNLALQNGNLAVEQARQVKKEAFAKYFPTVSATGVGFWFSNYMVDTEFSLGRLQTSFFSPISLSIEIPEIPFQMLKSGVMGGVTAVQPVFAGLRIVHGNQLASLGVKAAELQAKMSQDEVSEKVENLYWQIVSLKVKEQTINVLETQLNHIAEDAQAAVDAGVRNRNDLLMVQLKQQELASGKLRVANGQKVCKMLLRQYTKIPESDFDVVCDTFLMPAQPDDYFVESAQGVQQRVESQLLDLQVKAAELQTQMEIGERLPQLAVGAGYSARMIDVNDNNTDRHHFGMVFGTLSVPISDWWGGSHAIRKSRLSEQMARNERDNNLQLLSVQVEQAWNELTEAYEQILIAQKSIELATENLRLQRDGYEAGTVTMSDLLNAESLLQQSRDQYADAFVQYQNKKCSYFIKTGRNLSDFQ